MLNRDGDFSNAHASPLCKRSHGSTMEKASSCATAALADAPLHHLAAATLADVRGTAANAPLLSPAESVLRHFLSGEPMRGSAPNRQ